MILGDVLATVAIVLASALAAWAGSVLSAILFPERTERASMDFEHRAWKTFFIGLAMLVPVVVIGVVLIGAAAQVIGFPLLVGAVGVAVFGSGGLTRLVARRVSDHGGGTSSYQALAKGGALIVLAELMPVFGWFMVLPYVLVSSFGAGVLAIFRRPAKVEVVVPPRPEAQ